MGAIRDAMVCSFDYLVNFVFIGPLVAFYWRGTWTLLDIYVFPENKQFRCWFCLTAGNTILLVLTLLQKELTKINSIDNSIVTFTLSRGYLYILGFGCVSQWRGVWLVQDFYFGITWQSACVSTAVGTVILVGVRCTRSCLAAPLILYTDIEKNLYRIKGRFTVNPDLSWIFVADVLFTSIIVNTVVVVFWRGVWTLLDLYLCPDDSKLSALYTLLASNGLAFLCLIGRFPVWKIAKNLHTSNKVLLKMIIEEAFLLVAGVLCVCHWRGVWLLQDVLLIPEHQVLSAWTSHVIGVIALTLVLGFRSMVTAGCLLDNDIMHNTETCFFDLQYIRRIKGHFIRLLKTEPPKLEKRRSLSRRFSLVYVNSFSDIRTRL